MKKWLLVLALFLFPTAASAQCSGVFPNNTFCGNLSGAPTTPSPYTLPQVISSQLDAICSTNNDGLVRLSGTWQCMSFSSQFTVGSTLSITNMVNSVASNAALIATSTLTYPNGVWRITFNSTNGATPLFYSPSASPCSLNAGAGDNGSQVQSADSKCWLAQFPAQTATPQEFGAACDGSTDDTTPLKAVMAITQPMFLPYGSNCLFSAELDFAGTATKEISSPGRAAAALTMTNATQNGLVRTNGNFNIHDITITTNIAKTAGSAVLMGGSTNNVLGDVITHTEIVGSASLPLYIGINDNTDVIPAIIDNYILSAKFAGIVLNNVIASGGGEALILGNTLNTQIANGNGASGILYQTGLGPIRIADNLIESYDYGINVQAGTTAIVDSVVVTGNIFDGNLIGFSANPTGSADIDAILLTGNKFFPAATGASVLIAGASTWIDTISMTGNSFLFTESNSIHIAAGKTANIGPNTFLSIGGNVTAILLEASYPSAKAFIHDNTFDGSNAPINLNSNAVATVENNPGYNPVGAASVSPGASPYTYTAGSSPETLFMSASGGISAMTRGGVGILTFAVGNNVAYSVPVDPLDSIIITYGGSLTMQKMVH